MTLFTLLIIMALERVVDKSKRFHIATLCQNYFSYLSGNNIISASNEEQDTKNGKQAYLKNVPEALLIFLIAGIPSLVVWFLLTKLPGIFVFLLYLTLLWVCLGCPVTRKTYRRYLQAANREDFVACSLYSEQFGTQGGELSNVGKQLVLVNYRQYVSVVIFFVVLGLPGMLFYSIVKEWALHKKATSKVSKKDLGEELGKDLGNEQGTSNHDDRDKTAQTLLFILDWLPVRITTFGFLLVGHFSNAFSVWLDALLNMKLSTYDVLAKVAKASEDVPDQENSFLQEPLQMVKLVKRNVIFLLMGISAMTLVGVIA